MSTVFGVFGAKSFVVLIVAFVGLGPVILYYRKTPQWFVAAYGCLFVAAFATNFEDVFYPTALNLVEHFVGNLGSGLAFAGAAYGYRKQTIESDDGTQTDASPEA